VRRVSRSRTIDLLVCRVRDGGFRKRRAWDSMSMTRVLRICHQAPNHRMIEVSISPPRPPTMASPRGSEGE